jgi:hypothetical protein
MIGDLYLVVMKPGLHVHPVYQDNAVSDTLHHMPCKQVMLSLLLFLLLLNVCMHDKARKGRAEQDRTGHDRSV